MRRFELRSSLSALAALAGLMIVGTASPARADLELQITIDGNVFAPFTGPSGTFVTNGITTFNGVTVVVSSAASNSPGDPTSANTTGATNKITVANNAAHTVVINYGDTGFNSPTAPPALTMTSQLGGSVDTKLAAGSSITFQSYADPANRQNSTPGTFTTGLQNTYKQGNVTAAGSFALTDATPLTISTLASPYSMTSVTSVSIAAGSSGAVFNFSSSSQLTPTPEPSTIALAFAGLPALGLVWARRKRA